MRVSDNSMIRNFLTNLEQVRERVARRSNEVSSGKKITRPSQDPVGTARLLRLRDSMARINQHSRNAQRVEVKMGTTSGSLNSLRNLINTVTEKANQGINGIRSPQEQDAIATEIEQILENMVFIGNTSVDGERIFAGSEVLTQPFVLSGSTYTYEGDAYVHPIEIADSLTVNSNIVGSDVFTETDSDLLNTVAAVASNLRASDSDAVLALLPKLTAAAEQVDAARVKVAQTLNQVEDANSRHAEERLALTKEASHLEDADMAHSISQLLQDETALRASMSVGARLNQSTLFDILG